VKFKVSNTIFKAHPDLIEAVVVLRNINNRSDGSEILNLLRNEEEKKRKEFEDKTLSDHSMIKPWREAFRKFGSKPNKYSSSVEALLKRVFSGNELPDISPLVNLYNYCSIKHIFPFGGEDFCGIYGDMELKYSEGNEAFTPILSKEQEPPDKGEIAWIDDYGITCRKWNWRQCDRTKITEKTKEGYFIIDALPPATKEDVEKAAKEFIALAKEHLNAEGEIFWLDKDNPKAEIDIETKELSEIEKQKVKKLSSRKTVKKKQQKIRNYATPKNLFTQYADISLPACQLREILHKAIQKMGTPYQLAKDQIHIEHPQNEQFGDYSTNISMVLAGKLKNDPKEIADKLKEEINQLKKNDLIEQADVVGGFINFKLKKEWLISQLQQINIEKDTFGHSSRKKNFKVMVEFGQPNTHKMPHIGHLFSFVIGESLSRLVEALGFDLFRANYQGDIGPHVAKCIWAYMKNKPKVPDTYREKANLLQQMYQEGATAYKEDANIKDEIDELNKKIYLKETSITEIWKETRSWSVEFYKEFEEKLGVTYDRYYFESEAADPGKEIVLKNVGTVFKKSKGAIIFEGSKYGLHDRVFITQKDTPTYEAKDMALQKIKMKEWPFDTMITTTAHEQNEYFGVVFKALEELDENFKGKLNHLGFGMVHLKGGKMSSRTGNIITGINLVEQGIQEVRKIIKDRKNLTSEEIDHISEKVGIGAIKYSLLKTNPLLDVTFSFKESVSFEGDSGPYLQYTYARARSILRDTGSWETESLNQLGNEEEMTLLHTLYKFPEIVFEAGNNLAPNLICSYLFDLAQKFNLFYKKHKVLIAKTEGLRNARLALTAASAQVIKNGLYLLGIEVLEKM